MPVKESKEFYLRVPATCRPKAARDRDKHELTESMEEYTEGIYRLQEELGQVSTGDIAKYMNVEPASVTTMLKKLAEIGLVTHTPYQGVRLTEKGEKLSLSLLRKHRLLERLLVDFLELPWEDVHDLSCKLEHYISEEVASRIARALGYPTTCPHGNPVDATIQDGSERLSGREVGERLRVVKITDERLEFLTYLMEIGLIPQAHITVLERTPFGDVMTLEVEGRSKPVAIGRDVANSIWVRPQE
ncbi:MAG TPA: metal-dependent transcriptional regulator [Chthonomonadaceae bacterium]|nr:metal-dependent transcriptional regulator [Chthonomonadaceae bacterium]